MPPGPPSTLDLNADVGESFGRWRLGDDEALLPHLTSANVACGFHAGDPLTLRRTCEGAVHHGVAIGAQVGYRDLVGFGRRFVDVPPDELAADVLYQLGALDGIARAAGGGVGYLKPHGALYHAVTAHEGQARAVVEAVMAYGGLPVLGLPGSLLLTIAAEAGLPTVPEGFADRAYLPDGSLVPRGEPGAVLDDPSAAAEQAVRLAGAGQVRSLCVHGDSPGAVETAAAVRAALSDAGVQVASFA
ncbi:LamB/YcsF family protein [Nocardioides bizhenqiangii]|uniref:5-oxoprolinase subunit PxpA n=1 Tax=Nocardioides bizhenqiangii TaxID=3095076 RepID=A0ABZ0ZWU0_9ACTN|nr:5-oxoprolinase subunit PxpA [Nocardioides sp. HM61]WQQ28796.1 5-oxoprolinase subunit PxpA [Nocardioides sp. HM61]